MSDFKATDQSMCDFKAIDQSMCDFKVIDQSMCDFKVTDQRMCDFKVIDQIMDGAFYWTSPWLGTMSSEIKARSSENQELLNHSDLGPVVCQDTALCASPAGTNFVVLCL